MTRPDLGNALANVARMAFDEGRLDVARGTFAESLEILDEALPGHWAGHDGRPRLGTTLAALGRTTEGLAAITAAHAALAERLGEAHEATLAARADLGAVAEPGVP